MLKTKLSQFIKEDLDRVGVIMFNALIEIQVSPHALRCGLREGATCDCHVSIADEAIKRAKEIVNETR